MFNWFYREIIERNPTEFKIACLTDLKSLFPSKHPFYAGFGNRESDAQAYSAVDIPADRILIVNPSGTVTRADSTGFSSNYSTMALQMVDYLFPPLTNSEAPSTYNHWRNVPADVEGDLASYERKRKEMEAKNKNDAKKSRK